jgi:hypothetical protein
MGKYISWYFCRWCPYYLESFFGTDLRTPSNGDSIRQIYWTNHCSLCFMQMNSLTPHNNCTKWLYSCPHCIDEEYVEEDTSFQGNQSNQHPTLPH